MKPGKIAQIVHECALFWVKNTVLLFFLCVCVENRDEIICHIEQTCALLWFGFITVHTCE